jgi:hypothetical protein
MFKSFLQSPLVLLVPLVAIISVVGGYGLHKYQVIQAENNEIKLQLEAKKDKEISALKEGVQVTGNNNPVSSTESKSTVIGISASEPGSSKSVQKVGNMVGVSEKVDSTKKVMREAYDKAHSSKVRAVINGVTHQSRIDKAQDNINFGEGYLKVNQDLKSLISYFNNIYNQQITYEGKAIFFGNAVIAYDNVIMDGYNALVKRTDSASEKELDEMFKFFGEAKLIIDENDDGISFYATNSGSLETEIEGIVAAAQAKNSSAGMPTTIKVEYPPVSVSTVNTRMQCFSDGFLGGVRTSCF